MGEATEAPHGNRWVERARRSGTAAVAWVDDARPRIRAVDAAWEIWDRDRRKAATLLAGALVYRMFVWILPVCFLIVSLLGFVAETGTDTPEDLARDAGIGGYMVGVIADAAEQAKDSRWLILGLALVGMAVAGNSAVRALRLSHFLVWDVEPTKPRRHQWEAVLALLGVTLAAFVLAAGSWKARDISPGLGLSTVLATALAFTALWTLASWLLPHADAPWWALLPGALLGALGVLAMHLFTVYYLAGKIEHASQMYGSLGAAVAVLIWLSVFCRLIILGAGVNATLWHRRARHAASAASSGVGDGLFALAGAQSPAQPTPGEEAPMGTLTVWKFDSPGGAEAAQQTLVDLSRQKLITIVDAATVSWPEGRNRPHTRQLASMTAAGALSGSFWGLLFGLLFFVPLLGVAAGAAAGAIGGSMTDIGISDDFIKGVRREVTPGTSALFLLSSDAVVDKVKDAFAAHAPHLIHTNLSDEEEAKLREVFAD